MTRNATLMLLTCALAVSIAAEAADAKWKQRKRAAPVATQSAPGFHSQAARMIEVKPGRWISSYGCITDEGYGRYNSCDITDGGGGGR
jgi:hypothetical protein